ncbi:MAG TPA: hypothetical protein VFM14_00465, partial [Gemmatimonadales bacterium]|nr:hypothetical protein [Gemmatimonadales bacterium]
MPAPSSRSAVAALAAIAFALACGGSDLLLPGDGQPASLTIVQGNNQNTRVGEPLAQPIVVQVNDGAGRPVAQARVSFVATGGSGATFSPAFATTDNDGR